MKEVGMKMKFNIKKMKKLKSTILVFALLATSISAKAQVNYTYDNNGNRIKRELYLGPPMGERSFTPLPALNKSPIPEDAAMSIASNFGISVFPTQVNELLSLTILAANENAPAIVSIFDNLGKEVYNIKVQNSSQQQINFSSIKNGMYNLSIKIKNQQVFYKVVKGT